MDKNIDTDLVRKLTKILALTTSPSEGEAQAASAMLQRLLTEYNLTVADLEKRGAPVAAVTEDGHDLGKAAFTWKLNLAEAIASHYYCAPVVNRTQKTVKFVGRADNVESLKMLYAWVIDQIKAISADERRKHIASTGEHVDPLRWQVNFGLGVVSRLEGRLRDLREKREADESAAAQATTALVVMRDREVSDYLEQRYGYRADGLPTKRELEWQKKREEDERLKKDAPEVYYAMYPWARPLTPEQQKRQDKENEKADEKWRRQQERRSFRQRRPMSPEQERRQDQAYSARQSGRAAAERVNVEPFIADGGKVKEVQ